MNFTTALMHWMYVGYAIVMMFAAYMIGYYKDTTIATLFQQFARCNLPTGLLIFSLIIIISSALWPIVAATLIVWVIREQYCANWDEEDKANQLRRWGLL